MLRLAIVCGAVAAALGCNADDYSALRGPFNLNPFSNGFSDLIEKFSGAHLLKNYCADPKSPFLGMAYETMDKDRWMVLLKDVQGKVAGMQSMVPVDHMTKSGHLWTPGTGRLQNFFNNFTAYDGKTYYVQTIYFQDPATICKGGRNGNMVAGDGNGLWIQNGPNPLTNLFHAPHKESEIQSTEWANTGKCFWTMGQHYWGNVHKGLQCKNLIPYCLLYNGGCLDGFCFAVNTQFDDANFDSPHPDSKVLSQFMSDPATCMEDGDPDWTTFSTVHIYLRDNARRSFC